MERRLGEVCEFFKGKGLSKANISDNGKNECIRYGELYTKYTEIINKIKSKTNLIKSESFLSKSNDLLIPSSGETAWDIATVSCVKENDIILGGDLTVIRLKHQNGDFFSYYMSNVLRKDIAKLAQGNSVVHIYSSHLTKLKVLTPSLPEQEKIANFLSSIDKLIDLTQKQIEKGEEWKKGVMQGVFV